MRQVLGGAVGFCIFLSNQLKCGFVLVFLSLINFSLTHCHGNSLFRNEKMVVVLEIRVLKVW